MNVTVFDEELERAEPGTLAAKFLWLVVNMWPTNRPRPKTNSDIAEAVTEATGISVDRTTIWKLGKGKGDNPTLKTMKALRIFFGLPSIGYFDDSGEGSELSADDAALLVLLRDDGIGRTALRALAGLSPDGRATVADMIDSIARRERQRTEDGASRT